MTIVLVGMLGLTVCTPISTAPDVGQTADGNAEQHLETHIADLKVRTAALVASALAVLNALSPQERLSAPPVIWRVLGAPTEFKDCAVCPQMVVIPAGEFTMGPPPAEQSAEAQRRVTIAAPFAVSKFEITFDDWDACASEGDCGSFQSGRPRLGT